MKIYLHGTLNPKIELHTIKEALLILNYNKKEGNKICHLEILAESAAEITRLCKTLPPRLLMDLRPISDYRKLKDSPFRDKNGDLTKAAKKAFKLLNKTRPLPFGQSVLPYPLIIKSIKLP